MTRTSKMSDHRRTYLREYSKRWWKAHPEKQKAKWKRKYEKHKPEIKIQRAGYRARNIEAVRAGRRKWQSERWEHRQAYMRAYYKKNSGKIKSRVNSYYKLHKAAWWNYAQKRRALKRQAAFNLALIESFVISVKAKAEAICYYCGNALPGSSVHFDHIIPLSKGGAHSIENLCVACPDCNLSKNDKLLSRWTKLPQMFLSL